MEPERHRNKAHDECQGRQRRKNEASSDGALGAFLGLGSRHRKALTPVVDIDAIQPGAQQHGLLRIHRGNLGHRWWAVRAGHSTGMLGGFRKIQPVVRVHVADRHDLAPIHRIVTISAPMPTTQTTSPSVTGPMRSSPLPPGSWLAFNVCT